MKKILVFAKIFFVPQGSLCMGVTLNSKKSIIQKKVQLPHKKIFFVMSSPKKLTVRKVRVAADRVLNGIAVCSRIVPFRRTAYR